MTLVQRFLKDESGATAIEYGLIAAGISVAIIAVLAEVKDGLIAAFTKTSVALNKG
jgi:pilus assembly protein Flp/PilA